MTYSQKALHCSAFSVNSLLHLTGKCFGLIGYRHDITGNSVSHSGWSADLAAASKIGGPEARRTRQRNRLTIAELPSTPPLCRLKGRHALRLVAKSTRWPHRIGGALMDLAADTTTLRGGLLLAGLGRSLTLLSR